MSLAGAFWVKLAQAAEPGTPSSHDGKATAAAVPVVCEELRKRPWTHPDAGPAGVVDVALSVAQGTRHHDKGALDKLLEYTLGDPASTTVDRGMAMPLQVHRFDPPATHNAGSFMGGGPGGRRTLEASLATPRSMRRQSSDNVNATSPRARTVQNVTKKSFPCVPVVVSRIAPHTVFADEPLSHGLPGLCNVGTSSDSLQSSTTTMRVQLQYVAIALRCNTSICMPNY